jgi:hypothetical protein
MTDKKNIPPGGPVPGGAAGPDAPDAREADPVNADKARAAAGKDGAKEVEATRKLEKRGKHAPGTVEYEALDVADNPEAEADAKAAAEEATEEARKAAEPKQGAYVALAQLVLAKEGSPSTRREIAPGEVFDATEHELKGLRKGVAYKSNKKPK